MDQKTKIVLYHHRFGTDCWVAEADRAVASCVWVMLDSIDEIEDRDTKKLILQLVERDSFTEALRVYGDAMDESFEVRDVLGIDSTTDQEVKARAVGRLEVIGEVIGRRRRLTRNRFTKPRRDVMF